jgi:oxygen-independent coproporphyrinogen III oxidase
LAAGYVEIGMDHFALPTDGLALAIKSKKLHRNFMGYTNHQTDVLLGLGVSSISETADIFHQNEKVLPTYQKLVSDGKTPTFRGHCLNLEDQARRHQILQFMTTGRVTLLDEQKRQAQEFLKEMLEDGLIEFTSNQMILTDIGRPFLRNACMFFDERLKNKNPTTQVFSKSL